MFRSHNAGRLSAIALGILLGLSSAPAPAGAGIVKGRVSLEAQSLEEFLAGPPQETAKETAKPAAVETAAQMTASEVYQTVRSGIARISVRYGTDSDFAASVGTGFLFDHRGDIVTDCHVLRPPNATGRGIITVQFADDHIPLPASEIGCDPVSDIAVIRVGQDVSKRKLLEFAKPGSFAPGDEIVKVGYARGLPGEPSVARGGISALHRFDGKRGDLVQIDAPVTSGDSGGPILNMHGQVVAVTSSFATSTLDVAHLDSVQKAMRDQRLPSAEVEVDVISGMSFSRAAETASIFVQKIIADGGVSRLDIGAETFYVDPIYILPRQGAMIASILPHSPAEQAGLEIYDVICSVDPGDGMTLQTPDPAALQDAFAMTAAGKTVTIYYYRLTEQGLKSVKSGLIASDVDVHYDTKRIQFAPSQAVAQR
jgi:S1-C subfamily serine protease